MRISDMTIDWVQNIGRIHDLSHIRLRSYLPPREDYRRSIFACGELGDSYSWRPGLDPAADRCPQCVAVATALSALVPPHPSTPKDQPSKGEER
jgi:hypothetical protein